MCTVLGFLISHCFFLEQNFKWISRPNFWMEQLSLVGYPMINHFHGYDFLLPVHNQHHLADSSVVAKVAVQRCFSCVRLLYYNWRERMWREGFSEWRCWSKKEKSILYNSQSLVQSLIQLLLIVIINSASKLSHLF